MSQATLPAQETQLGADDVQAIDRLGDTYTRLREELARVIVGQDEVIERLAICLFARGHALLMGAPPKTQAAMLEAMQERRVTAIGKPFVLDAPFLVLATQNPVEQEGTYPLPEAQLDRFMFLIELDYPSEAEEIQIARTTTGDELPELKHLLNAEQIIDYQDLVRRVPVPDHIYAYAARLVRKTRPHGETAPEWLKPLVSWGAGPRAVQSLILGARARAALSGSYMVRQEDIEHVAFPVLTHRLITSFAAQAEGISAKEIVRRLVAETNEE
mgnify:CR=1 FL=1